MSDDSDEIGEENEDVQQSLIDEESFQVQNGKDGDVIEVIDTDEALVGSIYQMRPTLSEIFKASKVKAIIRETLTSTLQGKTYNVEEATQWTKQLADKINALVRDLNMPRYKHIVQVAIAQQLGSGCRYIAKCRWDAECDSLTSDVFSNASLYCICTVFGIYLY